LEILSNLIDFIKILSYFIIFYYSKCSIDYTHSPTRPEPDSSSTFFSTIVVSTKCFTPGMSDRSKTDNQSETGIYRQLFLRLHQPIKCPRVPPGCG